MTPYRFLPRRYTRGWAARRLLATVKLGLLALGLAVVGALVAYQLYFREVLTDLPDPTTIGQRRPAETTQIYARDGVTLLYEFVDPQGGRRTVVPFSQIPQLLKDATVAVEDANFYQNPGVDLRGILRALWQNYQAQDVVSGGSTITQQLVRNVLMPYEERTEVSLQRKLREAILAFRVSREYSKQQILGLYLNEVYYGNQAYGVEAAAQVYFGKPVGDLSPAEATLMAGLPQSPTDLDPYTNFAGARERQRIVLEAMVRQGYLSAEQAHAIFLTPPQLVPPVTRIAEPHLVFYVRRLLEQRYGPDVLYRGGLRVVTTLDLYWQSEAQRVVREQLATLRGRNATNAAVVLLSPENQLLAMVGSADYNDASIDGQVNVALAPRQPGSALKPVVYAAAMQRGWTPATVIWDTPTEFRSADGTPYAPRNYDDAWHGPQRLRMALANSLNIPAVKALEYAGVAQFVELAHAMGITTLDDPSRYGLPLALGAGEVRLLDLANVYSTFQNGGRFREPVAILRVTDSRGAVLERASTASGRQVLGPQGAQLAYLITSILSDNLARHFMFGAGNVMELPDGRPAAVKTGTSNEWRDAWALGYTPDITLGVWVGNSDNSAMDEIAGVNGAGVIWRELMLSYHRGRPIRPFEPPPGLEQATICADTGALAGEACPRPIEELFVAGSMPTHSDVRFETVRVAGDGACLPAAYTPTDQIISRTYAVYPPEFRSWAASHGVPQPPSEPCPPPSRNDRALAAIDFPSASAIITGNQVLIRGSAAGRYQLEVGAGREPDVWRSTGAGGQAVASSVLAVWRTDDLPNSEYTLRLRVSPTGTAPIETRVTVRLQRSP